MREVDMHFSRVVFGAAGLFVLLSILVLGIGGCSEKSPKLTANKTTKKIDCVTKITVDPTSGVDTHQFAVYICSGDTVTWDAKHGVTFTVQFPGVCPFNSCPDITDTQPTAIVAPQPADVTVYKYTITVNNGSPVDPHVVGGGGY
jgi:hypothetical protein